MCIERIVESTKDLSIGENHLHDQSKSKRKFLYNVNSMCDVSLSYTHWKSELGIPMTIVCST